MFKLIANRLLRQFQKHNLQHANELFMNFGQWAAHASRAAGKALTPAEAARIMGKSCECGVFNTARAENLLEKMLLEP